MLCLIGLSYAISGRGLVLRFSFLAVYAGLWSQTYFFNKLNRKRRIWRPGSKPRWCGVHSHGTRPLNCATGCQEGISGTWVSLWTKICDIYTVAHARLVDCRGDLGEGFEPCSTSGSYGKSVLMMLETLRFGATGDEQCDLGHWRS